MIALISLDSSVITFRAPRVGKRRQFGHLVEYGFPENREQESNRQVVALVRSLPVVHLFSATLNFAADPFSRRENAYLQPFVTTAI
jgi:hypothetical protein